MSVQTENRTDSAEKREPKLVQARLSPQTMDKLEHLEELTGATNRTQVVAAAIHLAELILTETRENNAELYMEKEDGTKERIRVLLGV